MKRTRRYDGFTMLELLVVVSILIVVAGISAPYMMRTIAQMRLRSSAASLASVLQRGRIQAVRDDRFYSILSNSTSSGGTLVFVDMNTSSPGTYLSTDPQVELAGLVSFVPTGGPSTTLLTCGSTGTPTTCPTGYTANLNYVPEAGTITPAFDPRGLPCVNSVTPSTAPTYPSSVCTRVDPITSKPVGFLYILQYTGMGSTSYAAVTVTPAGRISVWSYEGTDANGYGRWAQ
jgi:prepilin-type N-terminal cleavage/methylation domain-containing protein